MATDTSMPEAIAHGYTVMVNQMRQDCTELHILVCRVCGTVCDRDRVGPDPRPARGCIVTAKYANEANPCGACRGFASPDSHYEATPREIQWAAWQWATGVIEFQSSVADARIAEVTARLVDLEQRLAVLARLLPNAEL